MDLQAPRFKVRVALVDRYPQNMVGGNVLGADAVFECFGGEVIVGDHEVLVALQGIDENMLAVLEHERMVIKSLESIDHNRKEVQDEP